MNTLITNHPRNPVIELLENRLQAAMQIIAALTLTDEEGRAICWDEDFDSKPDPQWIHSMRKELLGEARPQLIEALRKVGFLTNTHSGFIFPTLAEGPMNHHELDAAYTHLDRMLVPYVQGEGEEVPSDGYAAEWSRRLQDAGFSAEISDQVMQYEGAMRVCVAGMDRLCSHRPSRTIERVSK